MSSIDLAACRGPFRRGPPGPEGPLAAASTASLGPPLMLPRLIIAAFVVVLVGFGVFLATWDMPPPSATVERTLSNDRLRP